MSKKTGRPGRYPGEAQERLSVKVRPRYKNALEMVAKHRGTTVTEAVELAVAMFATQYEAESKALIDYVRPHDEMLNMTKESLLRDDKEIAFAFDVDAASMPSCLTTPLEDYTNEVMSFSGNTKYELNRVTATVKEMWRQGYEKEQARELLVGALK